MSDKARSARDVVHETARVARLPWCPKVEGKHFVACDAWTAMLEADRGARRTIPSGGGDSGFVPYPADKPPRYNASGTPCDMLIGPCSCGATHGPRR